MQPRRSVRRRHGRFRPLCADSWASAHGRHHHGAGGRPGRLRAAAVRRRRVAIWHHARAVRGAVGSVRARAGIGLHDMKLCAHQRALRRCLRLRRLAAAVVPAVLRVLNRIHHRSRRAARRRLVLALHRVPVDRHRCQNCPVLSPAPTARDYSTLCADGPALLSSLNRALANNQLQDAEDSIWAVPTTSKVGTGTRNHTA